MWWWRRRDDYARPRWRLAGGLVLLPYGLWQLAAAVQPWQERAAYRRAAPCATAAADRCVRDVEALVLGTSTSGRRSYRRYEVALRLPDGRETRADLVEPRPVYQRVGPGSRVTARLWSGRVARLEVPGAGWSETEESPLAKSLDRTTSGLVAAALGAWWLWSAHALYRISGWAPADPDGLTTAGTGRRFVLGRALLALLPASFAASTVVWVFDAYDAGPAGVTFAAVLVLGWAVGVLGARRRA